MPAPKYFHNTRQNGRRDANARPTTVKITGTPDDSIIVASPQGDVTRQGDRLSENTRQTDTLLANMLTCLKLLAKTLASSILLSDRRR